jgi:hypothetical protein
MRSPKANETAQWRQAPILVVVTATCAVAALAGFLRAVLVAPLHVPLDPNEGWNAYHAVAAMAGNPYPPAKSFLINNYPPLSFYLVGLLGSRLGDEIVAGRFVSLAAFSGACLFIVIALRRLATDWSAAVFAVVLFATTLLLISDYVGMNDPQLLGHAVQLAGLLLVVRAPRTTSATLAAALFYLVGGFVKHNLFALPLATFAWLFVYDRQSAVRFAAGLLVFSLAGVLAASAGLHISLLNQLNSARTFSFAQIVANTLQWLPTAAVPLCGLLFLLFRRAGDEAVALIGLYAGISVVSGVLLLGGAGVDVNAMFDAEIALALSTGLAISRLLAGRRGLAAEVFCVFCVVPFAVIAFATPDWRNASFWLRPMQDETVLAHQDIAFLRAHPGPAMCEDLTFCYWAGKKASVDVFNLNQQFETAARDPGPFLRLIRSRYFRSIALDETTPFPLPNVVETVFLQSYRLDHQDDEGYFFVPR